MTFRRLLCRLFGHARPIQKLHCTICSRCRTVLEYTGFQLRITAVVRKDGNP